MRRSLVLIILASLLVPATTVLSQDINKIVAGIEAAKKKMKSRESKCCLVFSDLPQDQLAGIVGRMDLLGEDYARRLGSLGGSNVTKKMVLVVFKDPEDYFALGVLKQSGGVFTGNEMVLFDPEKDFVWHAPKRPSKAPIWHVIQHETFHLFSTAMINKDLPPWLDEGLAEYYGCLIFSGDAFFEGDVAGGDLKVVQKLIQDGKMKPFDKFIAMTRADWEKADRDDYEQAWSMVQFLLHGERGKYQKNFNAYLGDLAKNKPAKSAFAARFPDLKSLRKQYEDYWSSLTEDSTANVLAKSLAAAVTGAAARAGLSGQKFKDFDEFISALKDKSLKDKTKRPMPAEALANIESQFESVGKWSLTYAAGKPKVVLDVENGQYTGTAVTKPGEVVSVKVAAERRK